MRGGSADITSAAQEMLHLSRRLRTTAEISRYYVDVFLTMFYSPVTSFSYKFISRITQSTRDIASFEIT